MPLSKCLNDCLVVKMHLSVVYEKLAGETCDGAVQQLFRKYATDEYSQFESLRSLYEELIGCTFSPPAPQCIVIDDYYLTLLDCTTKELTIIDNYKALWQKLQAPEHRNLIYSLLQSEVRHGYGLLVLITPEELPVIRLAHSESHDIVQ